jgi:hypothetical protein
MHASQQRSTNVTINISKRHDRKTVVQVAIFVSVCWVFINGLILLSIKDTYPIRYKRDIAVASKASLSSALKTTDSTYSEETITFESEVETEPKEIEASDQRKRFLVLEQVKNKNEMSNVNESLHSPDEVGVHLPNEAFEVISMDYPNEVTNPPNLPGEMGSAVVIPDNLIAESKRRFNENEFNVVASELVALNRSLPEPYSPEEKAYAFYTASNSKRKI